MNDDNTGKAGMSMIDPEPREHFGRLRLRWAVPAALALSLGWPLGAAAADCDSEAGCLTVALNGLVSGFTGQAGSALWGWMIGGGQSAGSTAINTDLENIESTLDTIATDLSEIEAELEKLACGLDADFITQYAGPIQSYYQTYANWLSDMQSGSLPDLDDVSEWANCAVGFPTAGQSCQDSKILTYMNELNDTATGGGGSSGSISDCVEAKGGAPAAGSLDDRPYYLDNVQAVTDWYFTINTQAMIVLTEAYHFRAWQAAGSPKSSSADDIISNVCPPGTSGLPDGCIEPITIYGSLGSNGAGTGEFLPFVYDELKVGGAPYSTDSHLMVNGQGKMVVRSIERYNAAAGDNCPDPQVEPDCGRTVGSWNFKGPLASTPVGPYGYGGGGTAGTWQVADVSLFNALLDQGFNQTQTEPSDGYVTPGEFLCTMSMTEDPSACTQANGGAGLENAEKLVLFPESLPRYNVMGNFWFGPLACFMDGYMGRAISLQPFCQQQEFDQVIWQIRDGTDCDDEFYAKTQSYVKSSISYYPDWYDILVCRVNTGLYSWKTEWKTFPGYIGSDDLSLNPPAFWWPALPLDSITCDNGGSPLDAANLNPAGVPQLCREKDFRTWFDTIVPPGPTTTTAIADTTLDAAAPNTNDGAGAELELAGLRHGTTKVALLGFDPEQLQAFLEAGPLDNARLVLTSADTSVDRFGRNPSWKRKKAEKSRLVLRPLRDGFVEGNGNVAEQDRGTASGATWNCAEDADIANYAADCLQDWTRGRVHWRGYGHGPWLGFGSGWRRHGWDWDRGVSHDRGRDEAIVLVEDGHSGRVGWDVTEAVRRGVHAWSLQRILGIGSLAFVSREGAADLGDPSLAPTLILTHPVEESVSSSE